MNKDELVNKAVEMFSPNDTAIDCRLEVQGESYEVQFFETEFRQPEDYTGKPQHEVKGGLLAVTIKQCADKLLNEWMFGTNISYDGKLRFAPVSREKEAPLIITFQEGRCISYQKYIGKGIGIEIKLLISAKYITINDKKHNNLPKPIFV